MDEKLALSPKMVFITLFIVMSGVFRLQRGCDSALSTSELPYNIVCLHNHLGQTGSGAQCPPSAGLSLGCGGKQVLPSSVINHSPVRLALRVGNICFGKKFGITQQRVKVFILFTSELQRISGRGSDFFFSILLSSQLCLM